MFPSDFHPKKRFGQNFLKDKNIINKILNTTSLSSEDVVLEIGSGKGILTKGLAQKAKQVIAVELDRNLYEALRQQILDVSNLDLINIDILELNLKSLLEQRRIKSKIKVVANIPYSITTPILEYIFENINLFSDIYLMVQREFALRLVAQPNTKSYSSLSCFTQFHTDIKLLFSVKRTCFRPQPRVDSYFINLKPKKLDFWPITDKQLLFRIIRTAFNQRRKNILNSLATIADKKKISQILTQLNIDWQLRAENLSIQDYIKITDKIA